MCVRVDADAMHKGMYVDKTVKNVDEGFKTIAYDSQREGQSLRSQWARDGRPSVEHY